MDKKQKPTLHCLSDSHLSFKNTHGRKKKKESEKDISIKWKTKVSK